MKLNQNSIPKESICRFKFIKNRIFNVVYKNFLFKRILTIIYKFSLNTHKIMFLGVDKRYKGFLTFLKTKTIHVFIPVTFWINGMLSNQSVIRHLLFKNQFYCFINPKLNSTFNLIVIFNKFKYKKEIVKSTIFSITLHQNVNKRSFTYNLSNNIQNSMFFILLYTLFKTVYY